MIAVMRSASPRGTRARYLKTCLRTLNAQLMLESFNGHHVSSSKISPSAGKQPFFPGRGLKRSYGLHFLLPRQKFLIGIAGDRHKVFMPHLFRNGNRGHKHTVSRRKKFFNASKLRSQSPGFGRKFLNGCELFHLDAVQKLSKYFIRRFPETPFNFLLR